MVKPTGSTVVMTLIIHSKPQITPFRWNISIVRRVAPLTAVYVSVIVIGAQFLKRVEPTMYQAVRSLSVPISILFTRYLLRQRVRSRLKIVCGILCLGIWVASCDKLSLSWEGAFYGGLWAIVVALYGIIVKKTLAACRFDIWSVQ